MLNGRDTRNERRAASVDSGIAANRKSHRGND